MLQGPTGALSHWICTCVHITTHPKKALPGNKDSSGLNGLHSAPHEGIRAPSTPASGSSPAGAEVWAQEGAQVASVITMLHSDNAKRLVEEASFHGPTKLKVALNLRKHRTSAGQTPLRPESMNNPGQVSSSCREAVWEGDTTPLPCSTCTSI